MKRLIYSILLAGIIAMSTGCGKGWLTDLANNPNAPSSAPLPLLLPPVLQNYAQHVENGYRLQGTWMGYMAYSGGYSIDFNTINYYLDYTTGDWDFWLGQLKNVNYILQNSAGQKNMENFQAAALILKAFGYQYIVDSYNAGIYSQGFQGSKNFFPSYDAGQAIYDSCIANLDDAITLIQNTQANNPNAITLGNNDILYNGDMNKWLQFANTLKLRYLLRQSNVTDPAAEIAKTASVGYITSDAAVNPGYLSTSGKDNPLYDYWGITPGGTLGGGYKYLMAGGALMDFFKSNNDPRLFYVFAPAKIDPTMARFAKLDDTTSHYAAPYYGDRAKASALTNGSGQSGIGNGIVQKYNQNSRLITAAESYFMQAEAAQKGWINANAKTLFQQGITADFESLNINLGNGANADSAAEAYYTNSKPLCDWDATPDNRKVEAIITQKWAASAIIDNNEAWAEYRRTGFPVASILPLSRAPGSNNPIPFRYKFPKSESQSNQKSYSDGISKFGNDPYNSKVFWMK